VVIFCATERNLVLVNKEGRKSTENREWNINLGIIGGNRMKRYLGYIVAAVLLILALSGAAIAQDFQQLLGAVDRVESNLKALIDKEASARAADIAKLRKELSGQAIAGAPADSNSRFCSIQARTRFAVGRSKQAFFLAAATSFS
jgi:hypothetical protein